MNVRNLNLPDVKIITPDMFSDERGYFMETFHREKYFERGINVTFVQDNLSASHFGVLRGLHYQLNHPQGKLINVIQGKVFDVVVDLRRSSKYFGEWIGVYLSDENHDQLWVPPGFAHGFLSLSNETIFTYKCTDYYDSESERTLLWNDPVLEINWPIQEFIPKLSPKDAEGVLFQNAEVYK